MKKTKIFIFNPYSVLGGTDLSLSRLINFFIKKKKYDVSYICLNKTAINFYLKKKIHIIRIIKSRTFFSIWELRKIINKHNFTKYKKTVFISKQNYANVITALALKKFNYLKKIAIERTPLSELSTYENLTKLVKSSLIKLLIFFFYKKFDKIICISKSIEEGLKKISTCKTIMIYNPCFKEMVIKKRIRKNKHKKIILLNVARLDINKDQMTILKAVKKIKESENLNFMLIIIGYGEQFNILLKYIIKNSLTKYVKIIRSQNPSKFYKMADLFILSSKYEGFGNVLIEAGTFGIPIISTRSGGPIEILNNEKFGRFFNSGDSESLAKIITKFIKKEINIKKITLKHLKKFS